MKFRFFGLVALAFLTDGTASAQSLPSIYTQDGCTPTTYCSSSAVNSQEFGYGSLAAGSNSTASGYESVAGGNNSTAYGANAYALASGATAIGQGSTADAAGAVALGQGSSSNGRVNTVSVGNAATGLDRQITSVTPGTQGTDAVNLNQLDAGVTQSENYADTVGNRVQRNAYAGIAAALAQPSIPMLAPGKQWVGLRYGTYGGQNALGAAYAYQISQHWNAAAGASSSVNGGPVGVSVQAGYEW